MDIQWEVNTQTDMCSCLPFLIHPQSGSREEGVVYPGDVRLRVELESESISEDCSDVTHTSCTAVITRDEYTVIINQTNDIGSTVNEEKIDGELSED